VKELRGVKRLTLQPGQSENVIFTIKPEKDLRHYDVDAKRYAVDAGRYEVQVGASSADIRATQTFMVNR
jgi:beta-glucosidase